MSCREDEVVTAAGEAFGRFHLVRPCSCKCRTTSYAHCQALLNMDGLLRVSLDLLTPPTAHLVSVCRTSLHMQVQCSSSLNLLAALKTAEGLLHSYEVSA